MREEEIHQFTNVGITDIVEEVEHLCERKNLSEREKYFRCLIVEEILGVFLEHCKDNNEYSENSVIKTKEIKRIDGTFIKIAIKGEGYNPIEAFSKENDILSLDADNDAISAFRGSILLSQKEHISYRYQNGYNYIYIRVKKTEISRIMKVVYALFLSVVVGSLLYAVGNVWLLDKLDYYLFMPIQTLFFNALELITVPVVFFSIVTCINKFRNISELGKTSTKILSFYSLTTLIALGVGMLSFYIFKPGSNATGLKVTATNDAILKITEHTSEAQMSFIDIISSIVPNNFIVPITSSNMMQMIFVAILVGVAMNMLGSNVKVLQDFCAAGDELFLKITNLFIEVIPLATFCSLTSVIMRVGIGSLHALMFYLFTFIIGLVIMMGVYLILIFVFTRVNPFIFARKALKYINVPLSLGNSGAAVPMTIQFCTKKLGVSSKIASFSINVGANINMDGTCIMLIIGSLFLANIYGVSITAGSMLAFLISVVILSIGTPAISGAGLICISVLLIQLGVPAESIGIIMGVDQICGMFRAASNVMGDISAAFVVAKMQDDVKMDKYLKE